LIVADIVLFTGHVGRCGRRRTSADDADWLLIVPDVVLPARVWGRCAEYS
jgi:hypothetical protein